MAEDHQLDTRSIGFQTPNIGSPKTPCFIRHKRTFSPNFKMRCRALFQDSFIYSPNRRWSTMKKRNLVKDFSLALTNSDLSSALLEYVPKPSEVLKDVSADCKLELNRRHPVEAEVVNISKSPACDIKVVCNSLGSSEMFGQQQSQIPVIVRAPAFVSLTGREDTTSEKSQVKPRSCRQRACAQKNNNQRSRQSSQGQNNKHGGQFQGAGQTSPTILKQEAARKGRTSRKKQSETAVEAVRASSAKLNRSVVPIEHLPVPLKCSPVIHPRVSDKVVRRAKRDNKQTKPATVESVAAPLSIRTSSRVKAKLLNNQITTPGPDVRSSRFKPEVSQTELKLTRKKGDKRQLQTTLPHQLNTSALPVVEEKPQSKKRKGRPAKTASSSKLNSKKELNLTFTMKSASRKYLGVHCSIAGGISNAVKEAASIGTNAFGLFVRSSRTWKLKPLEDADVKKFKDACEEHDILPGHILPHGSFLLNCGSADPDILSKSRDTLVHELQTCERLGLQLYNFHPGSACKKGNFSECLATVAESINIAHQKTSYIKTVIENMSCQGNTVGGRFEELKSIIDGVRDKTRVGVCLDTCHAFAAGFDVSTQEGFNKFLEDFDQTVGLKYLCAMHLNDSKGKLGSHVDRHENIGKGQIGLECFRVIMNDSRLDDMPLILETPLNDYLKEILLLRDMEIL